MNIDDKIINGIRSCEWSAVDLLDERIRQGSDQSNIIFLINLLLFEEMMQRISLLVAVFERASKLLSAHEIIEKMFRDGGRISTHHACALAHLPNNIDKLFNFYCDMIPSISGVESRRLIASGLLIAVNSKERAEAFLKIISQIGEYDDEEKQKGLEKFKTRACSLVGKYI